MSTDNETTSPLAALILPKGNVALILFAKATHGALLNNTNFPDPKPPLAEFAEDIAAFEEAETKAASRTRGAAKLRNVKKKKVREDLFHYRDYVQGVVEKAPNAAAAAALIESAFMSVRKAPKRSTPEVSAKNGDVSGKVVLSAKAVAPAATYFWEYSEDQSTWTPVPETMQARTEVSGLTSARLYYFRFRALTRAGRQDYSHVVSLVVH
jgi:hypothetical protein